MPKSPEIPSLEGKKQKSLEEMDMHAIEAELKESGIDQPPRWFFYDEKQQRNLLQEVRDGKIKPGHRWLADTGDLSSFKKEKE